MWANDFLLYSRALQVAPNNPLLKVDLPNLACERGLYGAGIRLYKEVLEEDPRAFYNLGLTYYKLGDLKEADRYLTVATGLDAANPKSFLYLGLARMKMDRLREAELLIRHAVQVAPEGSPAYHFALRIVLKAEGDLKGSVEEFQAELAIAPQEQGARDQIAEIEKRLHVGAPGASESGQLAAPGPVHGSGTARWSGERPTPGVALPEQRE
jgi:tetratricopeptide (TPR) repeat protein